MPNLYMFEHKRQMYGNTNIRIPNFCAKNPYEFGIFATLFHYKLKVSHFGNFFIHSVSEYSWWNYFVENSFMSGRLHIVSHK